jgi:hypothetical protein
MNNLMLDKQTINKILYLNQDHIIKSSNVDVTELEKLNNLKLDGNNTEFLAGNGTYISLIIDNLTSEDTTKALSAAQGKILNDKINEIEASIQNASTELDNINGEEI